jgi:hypothetical protein
MALGRYPALQTLTLSTSLGCTIALEIFHLLLVDAEMPEIQDLGLHATRSHYGTFALLLDIQARALGRIVPRPVARQLRRCSVQIGRRWNYPAPTAITLGDSMRLGQLLDLEDRPGVLEIKYFQESEEEEEEDEYDEPRGGLVDSDDADYEDPWYHRDRMRRVSGF